MTDYRFALSAPHRHIQSRGAAESPVCCSSSSRVDNSSFHSQVGATHGDSPICAAPDHVAEALVAEYGRMRTLVRRKFRDAADAEDVLQDLCVKALAAAGSLRDRERLVPWIRSVLRNVIVDRYRREAVRKRAENGFLEIAVEAAESEPDRFAFCGCLEAAIPKLRLRYADVLRRVDIAREPRLDVAASLGISANNLRVQVLRARRALKRHLEAECTDCPAYNGEHCTCVAAAPAAADACTRAGMAEMEV